MADDRTGIDADLFQQIRASSAPGMEPEIVEKILQAYFSGKRDSIRTYKMVSLEIQGSHGTFRGMAVDISRTGMLLRIMDPHFASQDEMEHLMPYTARVWYHFESGFHVRFPDAGAAARGQVVRVTGHCGRGNSLILLGCRFRTALTEDECQRIGIEYAADRPPGT